MESSEGSNQACLHTDMAPQRSWQRVEEEVLLNVVEDIVANGGQADCGQFLLGTLRRIEQQLQTLLPNASLRATPHIDSKLKAWKRQYSIIYDMLNTRGFGWNENMKCVQVDDDAAWEAYVQHQPHARGWRDKPFPLYDRFANIWGKDPTTRRGARSPAKMARDIEAEQYNFADVDSDIGGSPMSANQNETTGDLPPSCSSNSTCKKRKRSFGLREFTGVFKRVMEKNNDVIAKLVENLSKANQNQDQAIVDELEKLGISFSDRVVIMRRFLRKPEDAKIFKTTRNDSDRLVFVQSILGDKQ